MPQYEVAGLILEANDPSLQGRLRRAKEAAQPVYCLCNPPQRAQMQIRSRSGGIILARWPKSASQHAADCPHSQVQENLTGLGQARRAITEHPDRERDLLRLGISLSKRQPNPEKKGGTGGQSLKGLSLRGLVHLLWTQAGLTSWHPMWGGKRGWRVVHARLVEAAKQFETQRFHLERVLFVPEQYRDPAKVDIERRRRAALSQLDDPLNKMLIIAELKDLPPDAVRDANIPFKVAIKQIPFGLMIAPEKIGAFEHRVRTARGALAGASTQGKLLIAGTFSKIGNAYWLHDFIVVAATDNWLLVESRRERELLEHMERTGQSFQQGLRFGLDLTKMIANVTWREGRDICVRSANQADEAERRGFRAKCARDGLTFVE